MDGRERDMHTPEEQLVDFEHPAKVYRLQYPAAWESLVQDQGQSCGFGPRDRDDVGIWISVLPCRVDTGRLHESLRQIFEAAVAGGHVANIREDPSLRHFGLKGDNTDPAQGGHFWLVAAGDLVLLASSQLPRAERDRWADPFDRLIAGLHIARDDALFDLRVTNALLERLRAHFPGREYAHDGQRIRSRDHVISPANLIREVRMAPGRQAELIDRFVAGLAVAGDDAPSAESLDAVRDRILPLLKPAAYVRWDGPTASVVSRPWLGDLIVCYAIRGDRTLRFILEGDTQRWRIGVGGLHRIARANLRRLPWPKRLEPAGSPGPGMIVLSARDGFDTSRLLHPGLHDLVAPVLGSPFLAGVPDRDSLLLFAAGEGSLPAGIVCTLREDFDRAPYPISPALFLVRPDGVTMAEGETEEHGGPMR